MFGHSSMQTAYDVYGHLFPNLEDDHAKTAAGGRPCIGRENRPRGAAGLSALAPIQSPLQRVPSRVSRCWALHYGCDKLRIRH
jgi:hypothetical protein